MLLQCALGITRKWITKFRHTRSLDRNSLRTSERTGFPNSLSRSVPIQTSLNPVTTISAKNRYVAHWWLSVAEAYSNPTFPIWNPGQPHGQPVEKIVPPSCLSFHEVSLVVVVSTGFWRSETPQYESVSVNVPPSRCIEPRG
jgi:hypothetical protein